MTNQAPWKLIQQYITGNCTPKARRMLEKWMDQDPANRRLVLEVQRIWELSPEEGFDVDVKNAWYRFRESEINSDLPRYSTNVDDTQRPARILMNVFRAAAIILVSAFAGYFTHAHMISLEKDTELPSEFYSMQKLVTDKQEKARVTFSDGTEVVVNSASSLSFPQQFDGSVREIQLDGEAYFKVAEDSERPFIVHTRDATIKVLGTKFNVRAWSEDVNADIVVQEGKVSVLSSLAKINPEEVLLVEGEFTSVRRGENPMPAQKVDSEKYLLWTAGGLYFDSTPLAQVFKQIERRFEVNIEIENSELVEVPFTSTFYEADLAEVLNVIAASMELEYYYEDSSIIFKKRISR